MKDPVKTALVVATETAVKKQTKKKQPVTFAVQRILKANKFSPLSIMINQVFPSLDTAKQADVLLKLMEYIYIKPKEVQPKRKGPGVQTNVQVNLPNQQQDTAKKIDPPKNAISLEDLLKLAGSPSDESK